MDWISIYLLTTSSSFFSFPSLSYNHHRCCTRNESISAISFCRVDLIVQTQQTIASVYVATLFPCTLPIFMFANLLPIPVQYRYSTRTRTLPPPYSFILAACIKIKIEIRRYYQEVPAYCSRRQWISESYRLSVIRRFLNFSITVRELMLIFIFIYSASATS